MSVKIQVRRDLAANWGSTTVLASGEFGYETDTGNLKIGDGTTQWQNLAYYQFPNVSVNPAVDLDLNSTNYRVMGRYRLNSITPGGSTFTNVPTDFGSTVDADSVSTLIVTTHAYPSLTTHVQQLLTQYSSSGSDLRQWVRLWNGTAWTNWSSTAHISDGEITTAKLADGSVATAKIADDAVTFAKMQNSAAAGLSVIGRSTNSAGDFSELAAANDGQVLRRSGTAVGFGTIATAGIADDAVTYAKIQNVTATDRVLGRSSVGAGDIEEITCTAAGRALLDDADATAQRTTLGLTTTSTTALTSIFAFLDQVGGATYFHFPVNSGNSLLGLYTGINSSSTTLNSGSSGAPESVFPLLGWGKSGNTLRPTSGTWSVLIGRPTATTYGAFCVRTA